MRLIYFGSGAFGLPTLGALAKQYDAVCVVTQPDRPAGRGSRLTPTPVGAWTAEHLPGARLLKPDKVNLQPVVADIRALSADAFVVVAFGQKLGRALLEGIFAINLHASLLPRWRGAAPINAAILAGDAHTGNSVITLADRMDAGLVLGQSRRPIDPLATAGELHDLLAADGPALVERVLEQHRTGTLQPVRQDESLVTIAPKLSKESGAIDFTQPAETLRRHIHALTPWPGVAVVIHPATPTPGANPIPATPLKLLRVQALPANHQQAHGILIDPAAGLISCAEGSTLRVLEVQPAGKRPMSWDDFARGAGRALTTGSQVMSAREAP